MAVPAMAASEESVTSTVHVNLIMSITVTDPNADGGIIFSDVVPGTTDQGADGQSDGSPAVEVNTAPENNVNVDIGIKGEISSDLALENWKYSITFADTKTGLTTSYVKVYDSASPGQSNAFYHWISVPAFTSPGEK
jgi:hypothetical protein